MRKDEKKEKPESQRTITRSESLDITPSDIKDISLKDAKNIISEMKDGLRLYRQIKKTSIERHASFYVQEFKFDEKEEKAEKANNNTYKDKITTERLTQSDLGFYGHKSDNQLS